MLLVIGLFRETSQGFEILISQDIVILGGTPWDPANNQTSGQMAMALAAAGNRVIYVARSSQSSRIREFAQRSGRQRKAHIDSGLRLVAPNLWSLNLRATASLFPLSYPEILRRWQLHNLRRAINSARKELKFDVATLLWCYWWMFPEMLLEYDESVFDVVDAHDAYPVNAKRTGLNAAQARLGLETASNATLTVAVSEALASQYGHVSRTLLLKPNGIDLGRVERALLRPLRDKHVPGVVVGYAGSTSTRIDWQLVTGLAMNHPSVTFEFYGGEAPNYVDLPGNVMFRGSQPYDDILDSIRLFDVAILPFENSEFTRASNFLKLLDYIALGVPVVAPPLPAVLMLKEPFPDLVHVAGNLDDWSLKIASTMRVRSSRRIPGMSQFSSARRAAEILDDVAIAALRE